MPDIGTAIGGISAVGGLFGGDEGDGGEAQAAISEKQLKLAQQVYKDYRQFLLPFEKAQVGAETELLPLRSKAIQDYLESGIEDREFYEKNYLPVEEAFAKSSLDGVENRSEFLTSRAASEVDKQFANQRERTERDYGRMGLDDPGSGSNAGLRRGFDVAQAAARADQVNNARINEERRVEDVNYQRLAQGVNAGRGLRRSSQPLTLPSVNFSNNPGTAANILSGASSSASGAANAEFKQNQANAADTAGSLYGLGQVADAIGAPTPGGPVSPGGTGAPVGPGGSPVAPGSYGAPSYGTKAGGVSIDTAAAGGLFKYAEGGEIDVMEQEQSYGLVRGPGTGTSDSINGSVEAPNGQTFDARFSDGEYVIPEKVVRYKGVEFFDNLVNKIFNKEGLNNDAGLSRGTPMAPAQSGGM